MIHKFLTLTRPLIVVDTETTGLDTQKDRIVELGFQVWTADGLKSEWRSLVNPQVLIEGKALETHGITNAMMEGCRICGGNPHGKLINGDKICICEEFKPIPTFKQLAETVAKGFSNCDFAGKNVRYDLRMLASEFARAGVEWSYVNARIIDADALERLLVPRHLSDLFRKYTGKEHVDAHGAIADVKATVDVLHGQMLACIRHTEDKLPSDLDTLHQLQWPGWIDPDGKFFFQDGIPCFTRWGKFALRPMADPEVNRRGRDGKSYWDFILTSDFSVDVKKIAAEAKFGKFPEMKS